MLGKYHDNDLIRVYARACVCAAEIVQCNWCTEDVHQLTYHLKSFSAILEKQCYGSVIRMLSTSDLIWVNICNGDTFVFMTVNYCSYDCKLLYL